MNPHLFFAIDGAILLLNDTAKNRADAPFAYAGMSVNSTIKTGIAGMQPGEDGSRKQGNERCFISLPSVTCVLMRPKIQYLKRVF